jgi:hypothetical protein
LIRASSQKSGQGIIYFSSSSQPGKRNISPLTNVIVANALRMDPGSAWAMDNLPFSGDELDNRIADAQESLQRAMGLDPANSELDFLSADLSAGDPTDEQDALLDRVKVFEQSGQDSFTVIVKDPVTNEAVIIQDNFLNDTNDQNFQADLGDTNIEQITSYEQLVQIIPVVTWTPVVVGTSPTPVVTTPAPVVNVTAPDTGSSSSGSSSSTGDSFDDLIKKGLAAVLPQDDKNPDFLLANTHFAAAVQKAGTVTVDKASTAYMGHAATRVVALTQRIKSDNNTNNGFNTVGDLLDGFGCNTSGRSDWKDVTCPPDNNEDLPTNSPTGEDMRVFLNTQMKGELEAAIAELGSVTAGFSYQITDGGKTYEVDYSDALVLKGVYQLLLSKVLVITAYDTNVDIDAKTNSTSSQTVEDMFVENDAFMTVRTDVTTQLGSAKTAYDSAIDSFRAARIAIVAENPPPNGVKEIFESDAQDEGPIQLTDQKAITFLDDLDNAQTQQATVMNVSSGEYNLDKAALNLNLSSLFGGTVDARNLLTVSGDKVGLADGTFGGLISVPVGNMIKADLPD